MNRYNDHAIGFKIIAYNLMVISNILSGERPRKIKRIVSCSNMRCHKKKFFWPRLQDDVSVKAGEVAGRVSDLRCSTMRFAALSLLILQGNKGQ